MTEMPNTEEYKTAQAERLNDFKYNVRLHTRGIMTESFPDNPVTAEDHIALGFHPLSTDRWQK